MIAASESDRLDCGMRVNERLKNILFTTKKRENKTSCLRREFTIINGKLSYLSGV